MASSFISPEKPKSVCFGCKNEIKRSQKVSYVKDEGLLNFKNQAREWEKLDIPFNVPEFQFTQVATRLKGKAENEEIILHANCRATFGSKIQRFKNKYQVVESPSRVQTKKFSDLASPPRTTRKNISNVKSLEKKCFVCNVKRTCDENPYNEGGLQRCECSATSEKILDRKAIFLDDPNHRLHDAAKRLDVILSGFSDIFAADVYYHQSCYIKFAINPQVEKKAQKHVDIISADEMSLFEFKVRTKIVRDREAYLLHELLNDVAELSSEQGLEKPVIENTKELKRQLIKRFGEEITFFPYGRHLFVHPIDINPCAYSVSTLKGCGLRDKDLARAFGKMIKSCTTRLSDTIFKFKKLYKANIS